MMRGIVLGIVTLPAGVVLGGCFSACPFSPCCGTPPPFCSSACFVSGSVPVSPRHHQGSALHRPRRTDSQFHPVCPGAGRAFHPCLAGGFSGPGERSTGGGHQGHRRHLRSHGALPPGPHPLQPAMHWLARNMRINEPAVVGLLLCLATSVPCCPSLTGWTAGARR